MSKNKINAGALAAAVCLLMLVAGACGDGGGNDQPDPSGAADQTEAAPADPEAEEPPPNTTEPPPPNTTEAPPTTTEAPPNSTEPPPTTTTEPAGPPHVAELVWGNFELAERIAAKLEAGERLNLVVSLAETDDSGLGPSYEHGWNRAGAEVAARYGVDINARVIGPNRADAEDQGSTIEALVASGDIDCLAVEAAGPRLLTDAVDRAVDAGVAVFSVGGDSPDSKRFAFYGLDDYAAGEAAGSLVGQWAADGGILVRRAGVLTGDASDPRSFDRMRGFIAGLSEIHSGVEFVNGPGDVESFGLDPLVAYDPSEAWVLGNLDVDIVFHTDRGLEAVAAVIADQLLYGDMYAVGFHMSERVTDYISERVVVAAMVQGASEQARLAGLACGDFLLGGAFETGHVVLEPTAVTRDNLEDLDWTLPENQ